MVVCIIALYKFNVYHVRIILHFFIVERGKGLPLYMNRYVVNLPSMYVWYLQGTSTSSFVNGPRVKGVFIPTL